MSDFALAITNAVENVYQDLGPQAPKHYWCLFHVLKAFKAQSKIFLGNQSGSAIKDLQSILYNTEDPTMPFILYWLQWRQVSQGFANYIKNQWEGMMSNWSFHFCMVQAFY